MHNIYTIYFINISKKLLVQQQSLKRQFFDGGCTEPSQLRNTVHFKHFFLQIFTIPKVYDRFHGVTVRSKMAGQ